MSKTFVGKFHRASGRVYLNVPKKIQDDIPIDQPVKVTVELVIQPKKTAEVSSNE